MNIFDLKVYNLAMEIGEKVWAIVHKWDYFEKDTVGKQLVRAVDSIAANLSEGFGRYHFKEKKNFGFYSRGSLYETRTWIEKANNRSLISESEFQYFKENVNLIGKLLNGYIKSIGNIQTRNENEINDPKPDYHTDEDIFSI